MRECRALVPPGKVPGVSGKNLERQTRSEPGATQYVLNPWPLQLPHHPAREWMELVRMPSRRRDLNVLLVQDEQRTVEIGARRVVDRRISVAVGGSIRRISRRREVARQLD